MAKAQPAKLVTRACSRVVPALGTARAQHEPAALCDGSGRSDVAQRGRRELTTTDIVVSPVRVRVSPSQEIPASRVIRGRPYSGLALVDEPPLAMPMAPEQARVISFAALSLCYRTRRAPRASSPSCQSGAGVSGTRAGTPLGRWSTSGSRRPRVDRAASRRHGSPRPRIRQGRGPLMLCMCTECDSTPGTDGESRSGQRRRRRAMSDAGVRSGTRSGRDPAEQAAGVPDQPASARATAFARLGSSRPKRCGRALRHLAGRG